MGPLQLIITTTKLSLIIIKNFVDCVFKVNKANFDLL